MPAPAYQRIADDIRHKITTGELASGDRLPTAADLAKQWQVSGAVVTQALGTLKAEGLLTSAPARGTFVRAPRKLLTWSLSEFESHRNDTYTADAWSIAVEKQDMKPSSTVTVRRIKATPEIATWLEVGEGETVIVRDRARSANEEPYMVGASYFPAWVAAGTRLEEPGDQSAPGGLLVEVGHPQVQVRDIVTAPVASGEEARSLHISEGSKVWSVLRIGYGADGRPVRAMRTIAPLDLWQLEFAHSVAPHEVPSPFLSRNYPADPYPGARADVSFVELNGAGWVVLPNPTSSEAPSGWSVDTGGSSSVDLDSWLTGQGAAPIPARLPVLAYGSNTSPGKIAWLREAMGLTGPAVVLEADVEGVAAVWSAGIRARDGQRPAVLAAAPGTTERHAVWLVTSEQRAVLDRAEGRGERYRLAWVHTPVTLTNGRRIEWVLAYVARPEVIGQQVEQHLNRSPLLVDGDMVRVADVSHEEARKLTADELADSDGLEVIEAKDEPSWSDIESRVGEVTVGG
ncbi:MAG: UTRA domain-containing protein [Pseudonocardiaceae bacterium]